MHKMYRTGMRNKYFDVFHMSMITFMLVVYLQLLINFLVSRLIILKEIGFLFRNKK